MSFFNSLKQLIIKIEQKNILLVSDNVDEIIYSKSVDYKSLCESLKLKPLDDKSTFIELTTFISECAKQMNYNVIKYFSPNKGIVDYLNQNQIIEVEQNKINDEFKEFNEPSIANSLIDFINMVKDEFQKSKNDEKAKSKIFILKMGDVLLEKNTNLEPIQLANLINSFVEFENEEINKFMRTKFKFIIISRTTQGFNQFISNNNVEFNSLSMLLPNKNERENFYKIFKDRFIFLKPSCKEIGHQDFKEVVALSDGMSFRELFQFSKISPLIIDDELSFKELYSIVSFNKKESEWEKIDFEKIKRIKEILSKRVKGQDYAINCTIKSLIRSYTGMNGIVHSTNNNKKPKGILFFVGPTGVGKTELAKSISEFVFGDENRIIRFDMSEFNHEHSDQRLIGAPPGYVGYDAGGELTNAVKQKPFSILLFDEIEKAHSKIMDKFLQILEDGRLKSSQGEIIDFSETFIIFTSNIGAANQLNNLNDETQVRKTFIEEVSKYFNIELGRPEILNRINYKNIVPFNFIKDENIIYQIVESKLNKIQENLREEKNIEINLKNNTTDLIVQKIMKSYNKNMGGRGVITELETYFIDPLSEFIFNNFEKIRNNKNNNMLSKLDISFEDSQLYIEFHN